MHSDPTLLGHTKLPLAWSNAPRARTTQGPMAGIDGDCGPCRIGSGRIVDGVGGAAVQHQPAGRTEPVRRSLLVGGGRRAARSRRFGRAAGRRADRRGAAGPVVHRFRFGRVRRSLGLLGGVHYIIDTSRNGLGPAPDGALNWCNPPGRALGALPTAVTAGTHSDAYLWIKRPGESDGACHPGERRPDCGSEATLSGSWTAGSPDAAVI